MPDSIIESVLSGQLSVELLLQWLSRKKEDSPQSVITCSRREFVAYFLSYLRCQTESILQANTNILQILKHQNTPENLSSHKKKVHCSSVEQSSGVVAVSEHTGNSCLKHDKQTSRSPIKERPSSHKKCNRRVKTRLFFEHNNEHSFPSSEKTPTQSLVLKTTSNRTESDESNISVGMESLIVSSTPLKNGLRPSDYPNLPVTSPVTPQPDTSQLKTSSKHSPFNQSREYQTERCDTPRIGHRLSSRSSSEKSTLSFGDYLVNPQSSKSSSKKKKSYNKSKDSTTETSQSSNVELDISNSEMFPEIGAKRLFNPHSERKRIKPTNIIQQEVPQEGGGFQLSFQQPSQIAFEANAAFKQQKIQPKELSKSFDVERNLLKSERHKLMEKFNILNTSASPKVSLMPQVTTSRKDSNEKHQNCIKADITKVNFLDKLDILVEIYDCLMRNNLVMNISGEIYYLVSILLSKQYEDDSVEVENKLRLLETDDNNLQLSEYLLRSVHNSSYFAVKSLWKQKHVLEVILDKSSLKLLGENKRMRSFYPDLAKFLLNLYGVKCEMENCSNEDDKSVNILENRVSNGIICFNFETDNSDNFPSIFSFQNFKKQRDLFYEIVRWWSESQTQTGSIGRSGLKARVKSLMSLAIAPANHMHLARLFRSHMLSECITTGQESKLSKLQRRLTSPASSAESNRIPSFSVKEQLYKDLIIFSDCEAFRAHVKDSIASEICALDCTSLTNCEDHSKSTTSEASQDYLILVKKLRLLSKFLGFILSLPYTMSPDYNSKSSTCAVLSNDPYLLPPKEKVLESEVSLRNYSQPPINLRDMLQNAFENNRLCITVPWLVQYLAMLDYASLRTNYYQVLLNQLLMIYQKCLVLPDSGLVMQKSTIVFLKLCLGWLFDLPHFPQGLFYETELEGCRLTKLSRQDSRDQAADQTSVDYMDLIHDQVLYEVCPHLKDLNVLLLTSHPSHEFKGSSFRHITPVTLSLNPDRVRSKEKELQTRLEEELIRGQPSSTRRVLEMVADRVTSATVKELVSTVLVTVRSQSRIEAVTLIKSWKDGGEKGQLLESLRSMYVIQLRNLHSQAREISKRSVENRTGMALQALLASGATKKPLEAVARRASLTRINKWLDENWGSTEILCKDVEDEMKNLLVFGDHLLSCNENRKVNMDIMQLPDDEFYTINASPAEVMIQLKEQICNLLIDGDSEDITILLKKARLCCKDDNILSTQFTIRAIMQLSVDLTVVYISRKPKEFNEAYLNLIDSLWNTCCPEREKNKPADDYLPDRREDLSPIPRNFDSDDVIATPVSSEDESDQKTAKIVLAETKEDTISDDKNETFYENSDNLLEFFNRILCPRNIVIMSNSKCKSVDVWEAMSKFLVFLLKNYYLSEDSLTEQCLAVYRQDWPQNILESLSSCMKSVSNLWGRSSTGKFTLFLDFLAEYCNDMDYEQDISVY